MKNGDTGGWILCVGKIIAKVHNKEDTDGESGQSDFPGKEE